MEGVVDSLDKRLSWEGILDMARQLYGSLEKNIYCKIRSQITIQIMAIYRELISLVEEIYLSLLHHLQESHLLYRVKGDNHCQIFSIMETDTQELQIYPRELPWKLSTPKI